MNIISFIFLDKVRCRLKPSVIQIFIFGEEILLLNVEAMKWNKLYHHSSVVPYKFSVVRKDLDKDGRTTTENYKHERYQQHVLKTNT